MKTAIVATRRGFAQELSINHGERPLFAVLNGTEALTAKSELQQWYSSLHHPGSRWGDCLHALRPNHGTHTAVVTIHQEIIHAVRTGTAEIYMVRTRNIRGSVWPLWGNKEGHVESMALPGDILIGLSGSWGANPLMLLRDLVVEHKDDFFELPKAIVRTIDHQKNIACGVLEILDDSHDRDL